MFGFQLTLRLTSPECKKLMPFPFKSKEKIEGFSFIVKSPIYIIPLLRFQHDGWVELGR